MRILFIGCVEMSKHLLAILLLHNFKVAGVISKDDTGFNADYFDITTIAQENNIPYLKTKNVNSQAVINWAQSIKPDLVYCFGWNSLLGKEFLCIAPKGVIGYHPAALPRNRGRHPIIWALVLGLEETASTFFFMGDGADDGDIVSQVRVPILAHDTAATLYEKLKNVATSQVLDFSKQITSSQLRPVPQDHEKANTWRKRSKGDGMIDFRMSARSIYNLVRGLTKPYPGAAVSRDGYTYPVWKVSISETPCTNLEPGKILNIDDSGILVKCGLSEEAVLISDHELPDFLKVGDYL